VQGGGDGKFKATEPLLAELPKRATGARTSRAHVTGLTPSEGTTRLLAALLTRDDPGQLPLVVEQRLLDLATTHACSPILTEVKPPTGEPCAGDPLARFGGRRS
jgi:hypothetical protein